VPRLFVLLKPIPVVVRHTSFVDKPLEERDSHVLREGIRALSEALIETEV
jgi:hypothetical protein